MIARFLMILMASAALWGCAGVQKQAVPKKHTARVEHGCTFMAAGLASWYGNEMAKGRKKNGELIFNPTASGEKFIPSGMTAAHRTLPFNSIVRVFPDGFDGNDDGVVVRINDRGPFIKDRIIDLSYGAAMALGMKNTQPVRVYLCQQ